MYSALSPGAIGVQATNIAEAIEAAKVGGFQGVEFDPEEIAVLIEAAGPTAVRALFQDARILPAAFGLPVDWRGTDEDWKAGLARLPRLAEAAAAIGAPRTNTWIMPCSDEREFAANYEFHVTRLAPVAKILAEFGCALGLEFIGPKTLWTSQKYPFIHIMEDMLSMGRAIGPNVGLLLDSYHWYTSHSTVEALRELTPDQVVYVHVNDAPLGVAIDDQLDGTRALPGETGVIDIAGFLSALKAIGYDGPITPEPFKKELNDLPSDADRLKTVGACMNKIMGR